ncbi:MAG: type II secretion system F family protein [Deferribacteraceae bacterium]|jgi:type II secretory pathway component PulF|nr:type II secretion system F family protein [Deferribacteraceae bacterium]
MITYKIHTIDEMGKSQIKTLEIANESQLQQYLDIMNLNVVKVEPVPGYMKYLDVRSLFGKIKTTQVIEILENLHVVVRSGLSMNTALLDLAKEADTPQIANILTDISYSIQLSSSLSAAMERHPKVFSSTVVGLIKIGEETGELESTLKDAAAYLKRIDNLRSKLKSAIVLPVFTLVMMAGAMAFWMIVVMPSLIDVFESFNMELPFLTRMIIASYYFMQANAVEVLAVAAVVIVAYIIAKKKIYAVQYKTDQTLLKIPVIGITLSYYNYAFVAEYTRLMVAAGLPLFQALGILSESLKNLVFKTGVMKARDLISSGRTFSSSIGELQMFTPLVVRMISVGEQTGSLEEQLTYVSKYYYDKVDYISENIAALIQPVLTVVLGLFLVIIMAGFLGPIGDMVGNIGK